MGDRNTQYLDIPQIEDLGDVDGAPATLASREGAPEKTLSFETKHYAPSEVCCLDMRIRFQDPTFQHRRV